MHLSVRDFSCIVSAELALGQMTIVIGPQASGKSVLSRLVYFFNDLFNEQFVAIEDVKSLSQFKETVRANFKRWFPIEAWGNGKFCIEYRAGDFQVRLTRTEYRGALSDNLRVWFSAYFEEVYDQALSQVEALIGKKGAEALEPFELTWRVQEAAEKRLSRDLRTNYIRRQLFIPAGRSFFTSVGKAIAAFEHGNAIDPLVTRFGRFISSVRERYQVYMRRSPSLQLLDSSTMERVFGGKIVIEREREYVRTPDGRKVSFPFLSSGQQELLPLWLALDAWGGRRQSGASQLIYIEEPEAHLFPSAQSVVVEQFARALQRTQGLRLFLTTHSPYVLSKISNLIKADQVARAALGDRAQRVDAIISQHSWLRARNVKAYAIQDGELISIMDEDGLVDASYLDDVSGEIASEYYSLLSIEVEK
jgi:energy-coupling factor transporter ATP-binding protein EcfA2